MRWTELDYAVLSEVFEQFSLVWDDNEKNKIYTAEEKPIATHFDLIACFPDVTSEEALGSINRLLAMNCVKKVHLYAPGDFVEIETGFGGPIRLVSSAMSRGADGYQITTFGLNQLEKKVEVKMVSFDLFISWSGKKSEEIAKVLRHWMKDLLPEVSPWVSSEDIEAGDVWFNSITDQLRSSQACIICITPENLHSPWLYYEAGAIRHVVTTAKIYPYLFDVSPSEIMGKPLAQFQAIQATKDGTLKMIKGINKNLTTVNIERMLENAFKSKWRSLEGKLTNIREKFSSTPPIMTIEKSVDSPALSPNASRLLCEAAKNDGKIYRYYDYPHCTIQVGDEEFIYTSKNRETQLWDSVIAELVTRNYISAIGSDGIFFLMSHEGFLASEQILTSG